MTQAEQTFKEWQENFESIGLTELAESKEVANHAYSDDLRYVVEMPDGSCVINTACSEYTTNTLNEFHAKIKEEDEVKV